MEKGKPERPDQERAGELIVCNLNGRDIVALSEIFSQQAKKLFDSDDFRKLDLGFEVPKGFLQLGGPQPTMAQLVVMAAKLKVQIVITHLEFKTLEQLNAEAAAKKPN